MLYAMIVALFLAFGSFLTLKTLFTAYIDNRYLSEESRLEREEGYYRDLQEYVNEGKLTSDDTERLARWVHNNRYLYVMIYKDDQLILDSGTADGIINPDKDDKEDKENPDDEGGEENPDENGNPDGDEKTPQEGDSEDKGEDQTETDKKPEEDKENEKLPNSGLTVTFPTRDDLIAYAEAKGTYPIEMADGTPILVSIVDYTEYLYYDIANISSLVVAIITLIIIIMLYFGSITGRITRLGRKVSKIAMGDINYSITDGMKEGNDEINTLAYNVENMRCSMLERISKEREAIESNNELITSMSHDIRTPLTVLLGYIDVMKMYNSDETMSEYIGAAENTTLRLKKMSDDMFNYFLVFGGEDIVADIGEYDLLTLFEQIMSENVTLMRERGYTIEWEAGDLYQKKDNRPTVLTDPPKLMRILENVFSNLMKYADKDQPIVISIDSENGSTNIKIVNSILHTTNKVESNHIGIKTCKKLSEIIGAAFSAEPYDDKFTVSITLKNGGASGE